MGISDVVYYEFNDEFSQFKMSVRIRRPKDEKLPKLNANQYLRFFGVAIYQSAFIFFKLKMADPIWRRKNENYLMLIKICMQRYAFLEVIYENLTMNQ